MFEHLGSAGPDQTSQAGSVPTRGLDIDGWTQALARPLRGVSDEERLRRIRSLEELKSAAAAVQARLAVDYADSQREVAESGAQPIVPAATDGLDSLRRRRRQVEARVATQLGQARRESPHGARAFLRSARVLIDDLPRTFAALQSGHLSEYRAGIVVRETACLDPEDRTHVDRVVCEDPDAVAALGNRRLEAAVKTAAYRTDPQVVVNRAAYAVTERRVSVRPAPDTMVWLTALLPVAQGVSAYAALVKSADSARATGDPRGRGQLMADTLVERLTGQAEAPAVPVELNLVMTDRALLAGDSEPAHLQGYGPIPAGVARGLAAASVASGRRTWVRRLYTSPESGQLVAMDSKARLFPPQLAKLITLRDQTCRTAYCNAPIRHIDHVVPVARGGGTTLENGQGLCEFCNQAKEAFSWPNGSSPPQGAPPDPVGTRSYPRDLYFPPLRLSA